MDFPFPLTTQFLNGVGVVGETILILLLIVFDKGITLKSRVTDRDKIIERQDVVIVRQDETIDWQRDSMIEKDRQIADLTRAAQMSAAGFQKVGVAAEQIASGGEGT